MPIHWKSTKQEKIAYNAFNQTRIMAFFDGAIFTSLLGLICLNEFVHSGHLLSVLVTGIVFFMISCVSSFFFIKRDQKMKRDDIDSYITARGVRIVLYLMFPIVYITFLIIIIVMP